VKQTESVKKDLKAKVKRLKEELARKEHAIKHFKSKLDERTEELEHVKNDHMVKYSSAVQELGISCS
jgi:predicted nuclease with TOPRIM domain